MRAKLLGCGRARGRSLTSREGRPTVSNTERSAAGSEGGEGHHVSHLGIDRRALHLVKNVSDLFQVRNVTTIWIERSIPRCALGEGVDEEFLNAPSVNLEVEFVRDRIDPALIKQKRPY